MAWIRNLIGRFIIKHARGEKPSLQAPPLRIFFPAACPLRPPVEPRHDGDIFTYLESQGNQTAALARFQNILKMDTVILELGCGNAEIAWQIALKNPAVGVIATDIYRSPCLTGSVSGYARASRAWTNGLLKAQVFAPENLVILRAGACLLRYLPARSIDTLLLVNPEPAMGRAFLNLLAETPEARRTVRRGRKQLVIKPFSKKMGITTCGGYEFNTETDWSRGIGFLLESPFVFRKASRIQWQVELDALSDYSKNSTQMEVSVCDDLEALPQTGKAGRLTLPPAGRPVRRPDNA